MQQTTKRPYRASDVTTAIDDGLDALQLAVYGAEERSGPAAALALVQGLVTKTKAATPAERRLERAVGELRRLMGDDDAGATLEALAAEFRAMQKDAGGPMGDVVKFLKQGRA